MYLFTLKRGCEGGSGRGGLAELGVHNFTLAVRRLRECDVLSEVVNMNGDLLFLIENSDVRWEMTKVRIDAHEINNNRERDALCFFYPRPTLQARCDDNMMSTSLEIITKESMMQKYTEQLEQCEVTVGIQTVAQASSSVEPHEGRPGPVTASANLWNTYNQLQRCGVIVKEEDEVCNVIKQELDIGPTVLQWRTAPAEPCVLLPQVCPPAPHTATLEPPETNAVVSTPRVKVEEHDCEDACGEWNVSTVVLNMNTADGADEGVLHERSCTPVETQDNHRDACCGSVVTECQCRTGTADVELDTLNMEKKGLLYDDSRNEANAAHAMAEAVPIWESIKITLRFLQFVF
ncbi:hypothetical protein EVAR_39620_1 [Eumeta japonica]|uniref:Uncharacterized protein n=1 Tax=Eumeta variegata TaxID=151549 RepID=A0A4C1WG38_EUMVA|nr:hypothetical protein EVAR_39620_1 [Eumeta japonica]